MTGVLRERVTFQARVRTLDAGGGAAVSWTTVATVWTRVEAAAGGETQDAEGRRHVTRYRLIIRRRTDIDPGQRALWRGRTLYVRGRQDDGPAAPYMTLSADDGDPL